MLVNRLTDHHPLVQKQGLALLVCLLSKACLLMLCWRLHSTHFPSLTGETTDGVTLEPLGRPPPPAAQAEPCPPGLPAIQGTPSYSPQSRVLSSPAELHARVQQTAAWLIAWSRVLDLRVWGLGLALLACPLLKARLVFPGL